MTQWTPGDVKAHIEFQQALNAELTERGELVDAQALAGPIWPSSWCRTGPAPR
jgi:hypothetical protein